MKIKKAKELSEVKVKYISILTDEVNPSNRQEVVIKSDNKFSLDFAVEKSDTVKGLLYTTPMKAMYEDTDGEYYENETVEKAAHEFMKSGNLENPSDTNHNYEIAKGVKVVESYVDKKETGYEWKAVLDVSGNEELMQKCIEGKVTGVSIAGTALVSQVDNPAIEKEETITVAASLRGTLIELIKDKIGYTDNEEISTYLYISDILVDGTFIFNLEIYNRKTDEYTDKYYKQAYVNNNGKVELVGEMSEVKRVQAYVNIDKSIIKSRSLNAELEKTIALKKQLSDLEKEEKKEKVVKVESVEKNKVVKIGLKIKRKDGGNE